MASAPGAPLSGLKLTDVALQGEQLPWVRLPAKCLVSSDGLHGPAPACLLLPVYLGGRGWEASRMVTCNRDSRRNRQVDNTWAWAAPSASGCLPEGTEAEA